MSQAEIKIDLLKIATEFNAAQSILQRILQAIKSNPKPPLAFLRNDVRVPVEPTLEELDPALSWVQKALAEGYDFPEEFFQRLSSWNYFLLSWDDVFRFNPSILVKILEQDRTFVDKKPEPSSKKIDRESAKDLREMEWLGESDVIKPPSFALPKPSLKEIMGGFFEDGGSESFNFFPDSEDDSSPEERSVLGELFWSFYHLKDGTVIIDLSGNDGGSNFENFVLRVQNTKIKEAQEWLKKELLEEAEEFLENANQAVQDLSHNKSKLQDFEEKDFHKAGKE